MADTVASPLLRTLSEKASSLFDGGSRQLKTLKLTLAETETLALDAENRSLEDEALRGWLTEVKDAAYEADDALDEFIIMHSYNKAINLAAVTQPLGRCKIRRKIEDIQARLDALLKRRMKFHKAVLPPVLVTDVVSKSPEGNSRIKVPHRETRSYISEKEIFGRAEDKKILLDRLLSNSVELREINIMPILGMGGLGKTTLAQLLYNDELVIHEFEARYWVSVGQDFDVRMIAKAIVETKTNLLGHFLSNTEETVDTIVRQELQGRRFLMVLDDVWSEDQEKWIILQRWFTVGSPGSAVILTTRNKNVADLMGTVEPYNLKPLSDDDSWSLFKHVAFSSMVDDEKGKLVEIGQRLVAKCQGLPLAIRTLAGLMRFKREEHDWQLVKDDDMWNLPEFGSSVFPALRLSYNHLPSHLKQCFAYCSIFPKDHIISKEKLIQLWVAEGFIQPRGGSKSPEDIGNDYFMELFWRSFFVETWTDSYGEIVKCRMHELIHDLARSVARVGCSIVESRKSQNVPEDVRYSSLVFDSDQQTTSAFELLHKAKKLRTLLLFSSINLEKIPELFLKLRRLRALDLSGSGIQKLSRSVGKLIHLRYFNLSRTHIETLPDSISKLQSLNTLELNECYNLLELPNSICELTKLKRLDIQSCCSLTHMPSRIGKLKLLEKLPLYVLSDVDDSGDINELRELDLKGKLEIQNLEFVSSPEDAVDAQLFNKQNLRSLVLSWSQQAPMTPDLSLAILENLKPASELKDLELTGYKGVSYPSWIMSSFLENLVNFSLINCSCDKLPPLGQLPNLKYLYIKEMVAVEVIDQEFYGGEGAKNAFPSLKQLQLYDMPNLRKWSSFDPVNTEGAASSHRIESAFPCLELLAIKGCSQLTRLPFLPNLKKLALWSSNEELLPSLDHLSTLSSLVIKEFQKPPSRPLGNLQSITKMTVYNSGELLDYLEDDMKGFSALKHLRILYCNKMESLPTGLRHLTSLQKLDIVECQKLAHIPDIIMENLSSLEEFTIEACPVLRSLPNSIGLPKLQKLTIRRCPELVKGLQPENSKEWSKIDSIPCIESDSVVYFNEEDAVSEA